MTDEELRKAYQLALGEQPWSDSEVDIDRIMTVLCGEASPEEAAAVVDLTVESTEWALAWKEAKHWLSLRAEPPPALAHRQPANNNLRWAGLLGLFVAAGLAFFTIGSAPDEVVYRAEDGPRIRWTSSPVLTRGEANASWEGVPAGAMVEVSVMTPALKSIFVERGLGLSHATIPAERVVGVEGALLWRVKATTTTGEFITGPTFRTTFED